jgi:hypothetical protein
MSRYARCWFCGRHFGNKQAVRAHLGWCREYARYKETGEEPPRIKKQDVRLLFVYRCQKCGNEKTYESSGSKRCMNCVFEEGIGRPVMEPIAIYLCVGNEKVKLK